MQHHRWSGLAVLWLALWLFRFFNSLSILSYLDPDEYWQSLEIAHLKVFGIGYQTWEWHRQIRSAIFPLLFIPFYALLKWTHLDHSQFLMV